MGTKTAQTEARGYGEPWVYTYPHVRDCNGVQVYQWDRNKERLAKCVTALERRDPDALPRLLRAIESAIQSPNHHEAALLRHAYEAFIMKPSGLFIGKSTDKKLQELTTVLKTLVDVVVSSLVYLRTIHNNKSRMKLLILKDPQPIIRQCERALQVASLHVSIPKFSKLKEPVAPEASEVHIDI